MSKHIANLVKPLSVKDEDDWSWEKMLKFSEKALVVMDCHPGWSGPCETLWPTFQRIFIETTDCEARCAFVSADLDKLKDKVKAILPADSKIKLEKQGCMPFFLMIKGKEVVATVVGANAPGINQTVAQYMPGKKEGELDD